MKLKSYYYPMLILILIVISFIICSGKSIAIGVRPLGLELDMKPGEEKGFEITLTPTDDSEIVRVSLFKPIQILDGSMTYQQLPVEFFPEAEWITLDKTEVQIYPGDNISLRGKVKVPLNAQGSHTVILMIEPQTQHNQQGVIFRIRYAVRLIIRIDRIGLRKRAELVDGWGLIPGEENQPLLEVQIKNDSDWDFEVSGEATIRDAQRNLIERVIMRSPASATANLDITRMYPGSHVQYLAEITKPLAPGDYTIQIFIKYGDYGQIVKSQHITIAEGQFDYSNADEMHIFAIEQQEIETTLQPGQRKTLAIDVRNETSEETMVLTKAQEVEANYSHSNLNWIQFHQEEIFLGARQSKKVLVTCVVPKDIPPGSYHSYLEFLAYPPQKKEQPLEQQKIPLTILIGDTGLRDIEIQNLYSIFTEEGYLFSLGVKNTGNIVCNPKAILIISQNDSIIESIPLTLSEGVDQLLPNKSQLLTGIAKDLNPGLYHVEIKIYSDNIELQKIEKDLTLKNE